MWAQHREFCGIALSDCPKLFKFLLGDAKNLARSKKKQSSGIPSTLVEVVKTVSLQKELNTHLESWACVSTGIPSPICWSPTLSLTSKSWCTTTSASAVTWTSNSIKSEWLIAAFWKLNIVFSLTDLWEPSLPILAPAPRCLHRCASSNYCLACPLISDIMILYGFIAGLFYSRRCGSGQIWKGPSAQRLGCKTTSRNWSPTATSHESTWNRWTNFGRSNILSHFQSASNNPSLPGWLTNVPNKHIILTFVPHTCCSKEGQKKRFDRGGLDYYPMSRVPRAAAASGDHLLRCKSVRLLCSTSRAVTTKKSALNSPTCTPMWKPFKSRVYCYVVVTA